MANIHTLNDYPPNNNNNRNVNNPSMMGYPNYPGTSNTQGQSPSILDVLFPRQIYTLKSLTFTIICITTIIYIIEFLLFIFYYEPHGYSWSCLLLNFGGLEITTIVNHYQYFRLITPMLLHNGFMHLFSNVISLVFVGFYVEYELRNMTNYLILFLVSGIMGNFCSLLFSHNNISVGISGAVLGICAYYVWSFAINYERMDRNQQCCFLMFFFIIFLNLFSGFSESGNVDMYSHIGGFIGGLAMSTILVHRAHLEYNFNQKIMKNLFYTSIGVLIALPVISLLVINFKKFQDRGQYICGISMR